MCMNRIASIGLIGILCAIENAASAALIGYYGLNEPDPLLNTTAVDSSPSAQNGTYLSEATGPTSIPSANADLYGTAVRFDSTMGHTSYVDIPSFTGLTDTGAFTYAAWINPDSTQLANPTIIGNLNSNHRGYDFRIALPTDGDGSVWNLKLNQPNGLSLPTSYVTTATIPSGVWTHVAVTKDVNDSGGVGTNTSTINFYVNGSLVESSTIGLTESTLATHYYIGAGRSGTQYFGGGIDEVRIYDEVLSDSAIAALAALPTPLPGDFNADGHVDGADFSVWQSSFPTSAGAGQSSGDADGDGDVDGADFVVWQTHYSPAAAASPATTAVPEPAGLSLLVIASLVGCAWLPTREIARFHCI